MAQPLENAMHSGDGPLAEAMDKTMDRSPTRKDKSQRSTAEMVLNDRILGVLEDLRKKEIVSAFHGSINAGKEANVFLAQAPTSTWLAVKIFQSGGLTFKHRSDYIRGERRFEKGFAKKDAVELWVQKEYRNLTRLHGAGIPCPQPIELRKLLIVMTLLGDKNGVAYPRLVDVDPVAEARVANPELSDKEAQQIWRRLYIQLLVHMRRIFKVCRLVHADLSEYNVLYHAGTLYIIDVSQSVEPDHPEALRFLNMDCRNVRKFFDRKGVDTLSSRRMVDFIMDEDARVDASVLPAMIEEAYAKREKDEELRRQQGQDVASASDAPSTDPGMNEESEEEDSDANDDDEETTDSASDNENREDWTPRVPRGRRFQDKAEKKLHKEAVKAGNREKRENKMPKKVKQALVKATKNTKRR